MTERSPISLPGDQQNTRDGAALHPRLIQDCHVLGRLERAHLLLHRRADIGWLILVPDTDAHDWHELDDAEHDRTSRQIRELSGFASDWFRADKINVATLGNEVAQMHTHIVARRRDDPCWPKPIWGHLPQESGGYETAARDALIHALCDALKLKRGRGHDA